MRTKKQLPTLKQKLRKGLRSGFLLVLVGLYLFVSGPATTTFAVSDADVKAITDNYPHFDPTADVCSTGSSAAAGAVDPTSSFLPTGAGATLEGHTLPATVGGVGREDKATLVGDHAELSTGAHLALAPNGLTENDVKFYINMRWRYSVWSWRGDGKKGPESNAWYGQAVRKVLVTNPKTHKGIVTSIVESGPAPWTGVQNGSGLAAPAYWQGYIDGTPPQYKGRVAGLSPDAFDALGTSAELERVPGKGIDLQYQWAPDQSMAAGTIVQDNKVVASSAADTVQCSDASGPAVGASSFVFYSQYDPRWTNHCYGNKANPCATRIGPSGCGPSSMAMVVATLVNKAITPVQTTDFGTSISSYGADGTSWFYFAAAAKHYGLNIKEVGKNLDQAISAMKNGALVIASGTGPSPYTGYVDATGVHGGHIIVLRGVTPDGKILLGDPNTKVPPATAANNTKPFEQSNIKQGLKNLWIITKDGN